VAPYTVQTSFDAGNTHDVEADSPAQARDLVLARLDYTPEHVVVMEPIPDVR
jgi:hypothetical protein